MFARLQIAVVMLLASVSPWDIPTLSIAKVMHWICITIRRCCGLSFVFLGQSDGLKLNVCEWSTGIDAINNGGAAESIAVFVWFWLGQSIAAAVWVVKWIACNDNTPWTNHEVVHRRHRRLEKCLKVVAECVADKILGLTPAQGVSGQWRQRQWTDSSNNCNSCHTHW